MKVQLKIYLPGLSSAIGRKELEVDFSGGTVHDLIEYLIERYGQEARQALHDEEGNLDPLVQVVLNGEEWLSPDKLDTLLHEGDNLLFMMIMAGG